MESTGTGARGGYELLTRGGKRAAGGCYSLEGGILAATYAG